MKNNIPSYFNKFTCIADKCQDTCCAGWDVVVDEEKEKYYKSVKGELGDKINRVLTTDEDFDRIFTLSENRRCPFLKENNLCELYIYLGKDSLCETCEMFPRFFENYGIFCETGLGFGCPEAVRIILNEEEPFHLVESETDSSEKYDVDENLLDFLVDLRSEMFEVLKTSEPLKKKLIKISDILFQASDIEDKKIENSYDDCVSVLSKMEFIDDARKNKILNTKVVKKRMSESCDSDIQKLIEYTLFRYFLKSLFDADVITKWKYSLFFAVCVKNIFENTEDLSFDNRVKILYGFSREIEYSQVNMDILDDALFYDFSVKGLIDLL